MIGCSTYVTVISVSDSGRYRTVLLGVALLAIVASAAGSATLAAASVSGQPPFLGEGKASSRNSPGRARPGALPTNFQETTVISGLTFPTVVRFASDGRVFVAEKSGLIKVFDNLSDTSPTVVADFRNRVHDYWDRGLLGLALDPSFPTSPYLYVLYAYDAPIGGTAPVWNDACPTPPARPQTDALSAVVYRGSNWQGT